MELDIDKDWIRVTNNNSELCCEETVFGKWCHVVWRTGANILEQNASICRYNKALPPDYVVFIQDYHKREYRLLRGYYNIVYCIVLQLFLFRWSFLQKWTRDNSFKFLKHVCIFLHSVDKKCHYLQKKKIQVWAIVTWKDVAALDTEAELACTSFMSWSLTLRTDVCTLMLNAFCVWMIKFWVMLGISYAISCVYDSFNLSCICLCSWWLSFIPTNENYLTVKLFIFQAHWDLQDPCLDQHIFLWEFKWMFSIQETFYLPSIWLMLILKFLIMNSEK